MAETNLINSVGDFTNPYQQTYPDTCAIKSQQLIMNDFESIQIGPNHGFENQRTEILTHDNFELKNISNGIE